MLTWILKATLAGPLLMRPGNGASTKALNVEKDGFVGIYYPATSGEQRIGVLILGGAEGGLPEKLAAPVVDAGYPTLALAYFNADGLPQDLERIPLEYFTQAKSWLRSQDNVKPEALIIVGWSKGAELALLLAAKDEQISKVVAIAPSSVVWAGILKDWTKVPASSWTKNGKELPHVAFNPSGPVNGLRDLYTQSLANREDDNKADIPVNNINAQVVLMTGENDEIWPAPIMANDICEKMNAKQENQCEHIYYENMDHLLNYKFLDKGTDEHRTFIDKLKAD
ncbi:acyl-CoA thioester hydrolase/BAAT C-terminal domain-containing protein [Salinimonas chungwhensis]|uniref:acyl-CoA thioester hydrolase/BAAT C-terminal domain-containing protein n=1 Tax=Salinimonas chungwhensis TaxID=265425 RepID=UPI00036A6A06|nr:acyl-CoA thioester hydrolase/BAAT C-terminal domain-containing protein [Salinimonas chungwhensis]